MSHCCVCNEGACKRHRVGSLSWCAKHQEGRDALFASRPKAHWGPPPSADPFAEPVNRPGQFVSGQPITSAGMNAVNGLSATTGLQMLMDPMMYGGAQPSGRAQFEAQRQTYAGQQRLVDQQASMLYKYAGMFDVDSGWPR